MDKNRQRIRKIAYAERVRTLLATNKRLTRSIHGSTINRKIEWWIIRCFVDRKSWHRSVRHELASVEIDFQYIAIEQIRPKLAVRTGARKLIDKDRLILPFERADFHVIAFASRSSQTLHLDNSILREAMQFFQRIYCHRHRVYCSVKRNAPIIPFD